MPTGGSGGDGASVKEKLDAAWLLLRLLDEHLLRLQPAVEAGDVAASEQFLARSKEKAAVKELVYELTAQLTKEVGRLN